MSLMKPSTILHQQRIQLLIADIGREGEEDVDSDVEDLQNKLLYSSVPINRLLEPAVHINSKEKEHHNEQHNETVNGDGNGALESAVLRLRTDASESEEETVPDFGDLMEDTTVFFFLSVNS